MARQNSIRSARLMTPGANTSGLGRIGRGDRQGQKQQRPEPGGTKNTP